MCARVGLLPPLHRHPSLSLFLSLSIYPSICLSRISDPSLFSFHSSLPSLPIVGFSPHVLCSPVVLFVNVFLFCAPHLFVLSLPPFLRLVSSVQCVSVLLTSLFPSRLTYFACFLTPPFSLFLIRSHLLFSLSSSSLTHPCFSLASQCNALL